MPQFPAVFELSSLDGNNGFRIDGAAAGDANGFSVATAGDVNGDGFADLIVSSNEADPNGAQSGASYVIFGQASGFAATVNVSSLDGSNGFKLSGIAANDGAGISVASAGDVNGDGYDDVIIGAAQSAGGADPDEHGQSYVVFGKASGFDANIDLASLNGSNGFIVTGKTESATGHSVASAGDINGDGYADLMIGAPIATSLGHPGNGATYVLYGKASGFASNIDLATLTRSQGFTLRGESTNDNSGHTVSSAGDVNGDGFDDMLVGTANAGLSYLVFGNAGTFPLNNNLSALDGVSGFRFQGVAGDDSGFSLASAGDINGDGFADIIIGAPTHSSNGQIQNGASYVVLGGLANLAALDSADGTADGHISLANLDGSNGFTLNGVATADRAGYTVSSAGDVNGDGFDDVIVKAPLADPNGTSSGSTYVVFGKAAGFAANIDLATLDGSNGFRLDGVAAFDANRGSAAAAGDINNDGFADIVIGNTETNGGAGSSYVVFGAAPDTAVSRTGTDASQTLAGGEFNDSLSGKGGNDHLFGHGGDDILNGGTGDDTLDGGAGNDTADYSDATGGVTVDLTLTGAQDTGGAGSDTLLGIEDVAGSEFDDVLSGAGGANVLTGQGGSDILIGHGGSDNLIGGSGDDRLRGGNGDDTLTGGAGRDVLIGGGGGDTFRFTDIADTGVTPATRDLIQDFLEGTDRIDLSAIDANAVNGGADDAFSFIGTTGFSHTAGELRQFSNGVNTIIAGDVDGNGTADFEITVKGLHTLSAVDFIL